MTINAVDESQCSHRGIIVETMKKKREKKNIRDISRLNMFKDWENRGGIYEVCEDKHVIA